MKQSKQREFVAEVCALLLVALLVNFVCAFAAWRMFG